ncbi:26S proteasome regulatory subunit 6B, partial [Goodea atripinnis]
VARPDKISGADINSICQEVSRHLIFELFRLNVGLFLILIFSPPSQAGMLAVRENRYIVLAKDFEKAYKTVIKKDEQEHEFYK